MILAPGRAGQREGVVLFETPALRPIFFPFRALPFGGQESREARAPTPRTAGRWPWTVGPYKGPWPVFRKDRRKDPFPVQRFKGPGPVPPSRPARTLPAGRLVGISALEHRAPAHLCGRQNEAGDVPARPRRHLTLAEVPLFVLEFRG